MGSRVSLIEGETLSLYAEWSKWNEIADFSYTVEDDSVTITGYSGNRSILSIPEYIEGKKVEYIAAEAFVGGGFETVVLPKSIKQIERRAFVNCALSKLYLFDNIEEIFDDCFVNCAEFSTLHINAVEPPRYMDKDRHSNMADKYDILIENQHKKKMILYSGSSGYFSVDTKQMEEVFRDYVCINMAVNGYFNGIVQTEIMNHYLNEGDVFIHAPESMGEYQLFNSYDMDDTRLYMALEANYDLLSLVDIRNIDRELNGFNMFNKTREKKEGQSYNDYVAYIDDRGNYAEYRKPYGKDEALSDEADIELDRFEDAVAMQKLNAYYTNLTKMGVELYLCGASINRHALEALYPEDYMGKAVQYDETFLAATGHKYPLIVPLTECVYDGKDFFDSDFHLSSELTKIHTDKIIQGLKKNGII